MNIYEKIQSVKKEILQANLKKTGINEYAKFNYYELADFLPTLINLCEKNKLYTKITFDNEVAKLIIKNTEKPDEIEEYTSPMRSLELKGCNEIQALGGIETYQRRYLYMSAFDIVENDMFDPTSGKPTTPKNNKQKEIKKLNIKNIDINSKVEFGKYKEKTWVEVYTENPKYFDWLIDNAKTPEGAEFYKKVREEIENSFASISEEEYKELVEQDKTVTPF